MNTRELVEKLLLSAVQGRIDMYAQDPETVVTACINLAIQLQDQLNKLDPNPNINWDSIHVNQYLVPAGYKLVREEEK